MYVLREVFEQWFSRINNLIPKSKKCILVLIDVEKVDGKRIFHMEDNVFLFYNYIKEKNKNLIFFIIPTNNLGGYFSFFEKLSNYFKLLYALIFCKYIIGKMPVLLKLVSQKHKMIFLGYYIPFKADRKLENCLEKYYKGYEQTWFKHSDFDNRDLTFITSSKYSSKIISYSMNIPIYLFKELGNPKDTLKNLRPSISIREIFDLKFEPKKVIIFTPTFRDRYVYNIDNPDLRNFNNVFGYSNEIEILESFFIEHDILMLIKLHKTYKIYRDLEKKLSKSNHKYFSNCYFITYEIEKKFNLSTYNLFSLSDAMIADYSSISFDYLIYDKPIIYNVPDIVEYRKYRGFSHEPIEDLMAGPIVKTISGLKNEILNIINNNDQWIDKRETVRSITNEVKEDQVMGNIYNYFFN